MESSEKQAILLEQKFQGVVRLVSGVRDIQDSGVQDSKPGVCSKS